jgi:hypothetical protein
MGGIHDVAALLYGYPINREILNEGYKTEFLYEQQMTGMKGVDRWVAEALQNGADFWGEEISKRELYNRFQSAHIPGCEHLSQATFTSTLNGLLAPPEKKIPTIRKGSAGRDGEWFVMPAYEAALEMFRVKMSMPGFMKDETETETSETPTVSTFDWDAAEDSAYDYDAAVQSAGAACAAASKHEADFDDALAALMGR